MKLTHSTDTGYILDHNNSTKIVRLSMITVPMANATALAPIILFNFIVPLIMFLKTFQLSALGPLPYRVVGIDDATTMGIVVNIINQAGVGWITYVEAYFYEILIVSFFTSMLVKADDLLEYLTGFKDIERLEEEDFYQFHKMMITMTNDLTE